MISLAKRLLQRRAEWPTLFAASSWLLTAGWAGQARIKAENVRPLLRGKCIPIIRIFIIRCSQLITKSAYRIHSSIQWNYLYKCVMRGVEATHSNIDGKMNRSASRIVCRHLCFFVCFHNQIRKSFRFSSLGWRKINKLHRIAYYHAPKQWCCRYISLHTSFSLDLVATFYLRGARHFASLPEKHENYFWIFPLLFLRCDAWNAYRFPCT